MIARRTNVSLALGCLTLLLTAGCGDSRDAAAPSVTPSPVATATATPVPPPMTRLLFTGDIIPARCTYARLRDLGGYTAPFHVLHDVLAGANITVGSLDTTLSDAGSPYGCTPTFNLAAPAAAVEGLRYAGFDVISHAANHIKDCGAATCGDAAMLETIANLRSAGIAPAGSGPNLAEARAPAVVARNGVRFAFLAYDDIAPWYHATAKAAGSAPLDAATIAQDIAAARRIADVVVVLPHWGIEYTRLPSARQREVARAAASAGADLIVGNHPHWVQAHETIAGTYVAYALGNFVFDQDWSTETQQGAMLEATFEGAKLAGVRYLPIRIYDQYQPRPAAPDEAAAIIARIEAASAALAGP